MDGDIKAPKSMNSPRQIFSFNVTEIDDPRSSPTPANIWGCPGTGKPVPGVKAVGTPVDVTGAGETSASLVNMLGFVSKSSIAITGHDSPLSPPSCIPGSSLIEGSWIRAGTTGSASSLLALAAGRVNWTGDVAFDALLFLGLAFVFVFVAAFAVTL